MFKKTAIVAGIGLALSATAQADYNWQVGAGYARVTVDQETKNTGSDEKTSNDADIVNLNGTYFLETVDTSKGPLGEAAFLDHASSISLAVTDGEVDFNDADDQDGQRYSFNSRYVAEGPGWKLSGWLVDLGYNYFEPGDAEVNSYNIGIGKYVTPNTTLVLGYTAVDVNSGGNPSEQDNTDAVDLALDHFFAFSSGGLKTSANIGRIAVDGDDGDDIDSYGLGATWYLNNNWGFGANWARLAQDSREVDVYGVNAQWFVTENFAVDLGYAQSNPDDQNNPLGTGGKLETEIDGFSVGGLFRF